MLGLITPAFAAGNEKKTSDVKEHLQNHFKVYGFIRNYFAYDSREGVAGTGDLFYWAPKDNAWNYTPEQAAALNTERQDLNARSQFRFLSLTSRVGLDVSGYKVQGMEFGAKVEADFYAGLTGSTGTAQLRLRQAFATIKWDNLGKNRDMSAFMKIGQAWHPLAADMPDIYSLETGAPFGPFSRTPLVQADFNLTKNLTLTGAAIWQMQYSSMGPKGASADYIKYGCTPEFYFGVTGKTNGLLGRVGVNVTSIKPRSVDDSGKHMVKDRMTTALLFVYGQYTKDLLRIKAKTVYGGAGEQMGLFSGYGMLQMDYGSADPSRRYVPLRSSSTWASVSYGKKVIGSLFVGYLQNFGSSRDMTEFYLSPNVTKAVSDGSINRMVRVEPEVTYNIGKFTVGMEYMMTVAQFGTWVAGSGDDVKAVALAARRGLATGNLHWVANHRLQAMVKFNF